MATVIVTGTWQKISTGRGVFLQNTGISPIRVKYSNTAPADYTSFIVYPKSVESFQSGGLPIWVSASSEVATTVVYEYLSAPANFEMEVGLGRKDDHESTGVQGFRTSLNNGNLYDLWCGSDDIKTDLSVAEPLRVVSTDADDTSGGSGAEFIFINGLDANFDPQLEVLALNGTTPVVSVNSFLRVNTSAIGGASPLANIGAISVVSSVSELEIDCIAPTEGFSCTAALTVPANHTGILSTLTGGCERNDDAKLILKVKIPIVTGGAYITTLKQPMSPLATGLSNQSFGFPEKTDIKLQVLANSHIDYAVGTLAMLFIPTL